MTEAQANINNAIKALKVARFYLNYVKDTLGNDKCAGTPKQRAIDRASLTSQTAQISKLLDEIQAGLDKDLEENTI